MITFCSSSLVVKRKLSCDRNSCFVIEVLEMAVIYALISFQPKEKWNFFYT